MMTSSAGWCLVALTRCTWTVGAATAAGELVWLGDGVGVAIELDDELGDGDELGFGAEPGDDDEGVGEGDELGPLGSPGSGTVSGFELELGLDVGVGVGVAVLLWLTEGVGVGLASAQTAPSSKS